MPRIFRAMINDGGRPKIGPSARGLGVRIPPDKHPDLLVGPDGTVEPGTGGMSVAPTWRDLPIHRIPMRLQPIVSDACGKDADACWRMGAGAFSATSVTEELSLAIGSAVHGTVEPAHSMAAESFQSALKATRDDWEIDES